MREPSRLWPRPFQKHSLSFEALSFADGNFYHVMATLLPAAEPEVATIFNSSLYLYHAKYWPSKHIFLNALELAKPARFADIQR
jgi:hypothetical protein